MRFMSVCSGVEAASLAWRGLGWEPVAFSEIEPFPCAVLANMRLIKNAPELLELLVEMMHEGCIETTYVDRVRKTVEKVLQEEGR